MKNALPDSSRGASLRLRTSKLLRSTWNETQLCRRWNASWPRKKKRASLLHSFQRAKKKKLKQLTTRQWLPPVNLARKPRSSTLPVILAANRSRLLRKSRRTKPRKSKWWKNTFNLGKLPMPVFCWTSTLLHLAQAKSKSKHPPRNQKRASVWRNCNKRRRRDWI